MRYYTNSVRWRLPASYALIALLAALSLGSLMLLVLKGYYQEQEREYLFGNATTLRPVIEQIMQSSLPQSSLRDQINGLAFLSQTQIRVLDINGNILADSGAPVSNRVVAVSGGMPVAGNVMLSVPANPPPDKVPANPPPDKGPVFVFRSDEGPQFSEVVPFEKQIATGKSGDIILSVNASPYGYGFVTRTESDPARRSTQSVSVLLQTSRGNKLGVLEFSNGPSYGADVIDSVRNAWLLASIFATILAALTGWFMSKRVTRPVLALETATRQMEQGDLSVRVDLHNERQQEFLSLAHSFNGMAAQVEQTVSTLREFVADAAHELHTPLAALQANIELARDEKNASDQTRYLSRAQEQGRRLEALVTSLLDLSRIEAAESRSDSAPVDMVQLIREVGEQFASRAEQADRIFTMKLPDGDVHVQGHATQLRQVFINLLENALKFTPAHGTIALDVQRSEHEVTFTIADSGIGIPAEDVPHLFERFHRARNVSEYPGNGLGLAIVKAIVDVHAGDVVVRSEENRGTAISVTFTAL